MLGQSVLGELAEHLRGRVGAVRRSLAGRNAALRKCPTGGGRTLELKWTVADLGDHDVRAVKLLSERSVMAIPEEDRQLVFDFIVRRLQRATETSRTRPTPTSAAAASPRPSTTARGSPSNSTSASWTAASNGSPDASTARARAASSQRS